MKSSSALSIFTLTFISPERYHNRTLVSGEESARALWEPSVLFQGDPTLQIPRLSCTDPQPLRTASSNGIIDSSTYWYYRGLYNFLYYFGGSLLQL